MIFEDLTAGVSIFLMRIRWSTIFSRIRHSVRPAPRCWNALRMASFKVSLRRMC
jgi:hypothetical protein